MKRAALAAIAVAIVFTAPACRGSAMSDGDSQPVSFIPIDPNSASPTDRAIGKAQAQLQANDKDDNARIELSVAYLQKARETADPSLYLKVDGLLKAAKKTKTEDANYYVVLGTLDLAQHQFEDAAKNGQKAIELNAGSSAAYGVLADANNELGNSDAALQATQKMLDIRPDLAALSRASYARELRGDLPGAIEAMTQAVSAAGSGGENIAYVQTLLGNLLLTNGDVREAETAYSDALVSFPGFAAAEAGHAQVLVARGKYDQAAAQLADILKRQPLETYAVSRGDALMAADRTAEADEAYRLVEAINTLFAANGVVVDREAALFAADRQGGDVPVKQAREALKERGSLAGHDVLAWALFRDGKPRDAEKESDKALSDGVKDPMQRYHAAVIALANGNRDKARTQLQVVLDTNPFFSGASIQSIKDMAAELGLNIPRPVNS